MFDNSFTINEIRVFSVPNLIEGAAVIKAPAANQTKFSAKNLVENQEKRSGRKTINAIIDWNRMTGASRVVTRSP